MMTLFRLVLEKFGVAGVLLVAAYLAIAVGSLLGLAWSIAAAAVRACRRWQLRRELSVLRGGRARFTLPGELVDRPVRPPVRSLRQPGGPDAA